MENIEGTIKKGQSIETGNTGYTRRTKQNKAKTVANCVGHHYTQTMQTYISAPTNNWRQRRTEPRGHRNGHHNTELGT